MLLAFTLPVVALIVLSAPLTAELGEDRSTRSLARAIAAEHPADIEVVGIEVMPPSLAFYLGRPLALASADGDPLRSNYLLRRYESLVDIAPTLRSPAWLAEVLLDCATPRLFLVDQRHETTHRRSRDARTPPDLRDRSLQGLRRLRGAERSARRAQRDRARDREERRMSERRAPDGPNYSVVVPFFNESGNASALVAEIEATMEALGASWELLMVDDGSRDGTGELLAAAARRRPELRHLRLPQNRGQAAALDAGLRRARGKVLITMDGDGQNDPADIPALLELLGSADMVVGIRAGRRDSWLRRAMSRLANSIRGRLLDDRMQDSGCALKAFRAEVVDTLLPLKTLYSFMPALARAGGFRLAEHPVRHRPRLAGRSSYGFVTFLWRPALDLLGVWWLRQRTFARRGVEVEELGARGNSDDPAPSATADQTPPQALPEGGASGPRFG